MRNQHQGGKIQVRIWSCGDRGVAATMPEGTTGGACVLRGRERAGQPPEVLPSLRGTQGPPPAGLPAQGPPSGPSKQTRPPLTDERGWGGGSARKGRLCRELCRNARPPPAPRGLRPPAPGPLYRARALSTQRLRPPLRALLSPPGCLSGLVPDDHRACHCHYHLLIRAELPGRQEWQAHVPGPAEEARPRPLLVAGHPLPFPSSSCRPPRLGH